MIEIIIRNGYFESINALISYKYNYCLYNGSKYEVTDEFKNNLVRIIRTWKSNNNKNKNIDKNQYKIIVTMNDNKKELINCSGIYPNGYKQLIDLLGGLNE